MYRLYCRVFQIIMRVGSDFLPWRKPNLLKGMGSLEKLPNAIRQCDISRVLIVTDMGIVSSGLIEGLLHNLKAQKIKYCIYDKTVPNPTIDNVEEAVTLYRENHCKGIIGFGGGSSLDCAKGVAARVARQDLSITQMKGLFKIRKRTPILFAIPTTSGTGSEATIAAVITNRITHEKYPINDLALIPEYAVLDPLVTRKLPSHITSTTGMDALTHAIEAYIGYSNTKETRAYSKRAVKLVFDYLYIAYSDGENMKARAKMQMAAFYAGVAFTRAYVGNVHAIAHTLGGFYSIPHGLANAVLLPFVLEYYGYTVYKPLSELADLVGISKDGDSTKQKSERFIKEIKKLNSKMDIPEKLKGIEEKDIPVMAKRAFREANPLYPVPMILEEAEFRLLYYWIMD